MENELFEKSPVPKVYFTLALPVVLSMVISLIYNMADTYFVAKTQNTNLVAAVSLCAPLFTLMVALGDIFGIGGSSIISRLFGQKKYKEANSVNGFCCLGAIVCGILITILMLIFKTPLLNLLGANTETLPYASSYYTIIAIGATFIIFQFSPSNIIRTEGLAKESMFGTILGSIINIILDPIFILGLNMGAAGAAIATIIGYIASDILFIYFMNHRSKKLDFKVKKYIISNEEIKQIFSIGIPASTTNLMASLATTITNRYLVTFGNDKVAAMGIALKVNMIVMLIMVGFAFGAQPLLGYNYGAGNKKRLRDIIRFDILVEIVFAICTSIILAIFAPQIIHCFMQNQQIINAGSTMLRCLIISSPCLGLILVFTTLFQSEGKALPAFILSISRQGIIYIIVITILSQMLGYTGIIISQAISDVLTAILAILIYIKRR